MMACMLVQALAVPNRGEDDPLSRLTGLNL
jgi:hypothetical protein